MLRITVADLGLLYAQFYPNNTNVIVADVAYGLSVLRTDSNFQATYLVRNHPIA